MARMLSSQKGTEDVGLIAEDTFIFPIVKIAIISHDFLFYEVKSDNHFRQVWSDMFHVG